jgi:hypothetical protein
VSEAGTLVFTPAGGGAQKKTRRFTTFCLFRNAAQPAMKKRTKLADGRKPSHSLDAARPSKGKGRDAATVRVSF